MKSAEEYKAIFYRQLALDYCCRPEDILSGRNQFHVYRPLEGRRQFWTGEDCLLKAASVRGRILLTGRADIVEWCRDRYAMTEGAWFMEPPVMKELNRMLEQHGYEIDQLHPFFLSFREGPARTGAYQIRWYRDREIEVFRGDARFSNAYSFCPTAPDRIGVGAFRDGKLLGMAGASADSPDLWQIGIDVLPEARGGGIGVMLVSLLRNEILREGKVPFYGAAVSHAISQSIAVRAGFVPAWAELTTRRIPVS